MCMAPMAPPPKHEWPPYSKHYRGQPIRQAPQYEPPQLAWSVRHPHLTTGAIGVAIMVVLVAAKLIGG